MKLERRTYTHKYNTLMVNFYMVWLIYLDPKPLLTICLLSVILFQSIASLNCNYL